MISQEHINT